MAIDISIGQVSGIIALFVFLVQIFVPNLGVLILASCMGAEQSALTWSVAARTVQSSNWPTIIRSESSMAKSTPRRILAATSIPTALLALLAVAGIVTPLGLYSKSASTSSTALNFKYIPDHSGLAVDTRFSDTSFLNRLCIYSDLGFHGYQCPYTPGNITYVKDKNGLSAKFHISGNNRTISIGIPQILRDRFTSGLKDFARTVSSIFDIQWRSHRWVYNSAYNDDKSWLMGTFKMLAPRILEEQVYLAEGLLVDVGNGRIAFRNHTAPVGYKYGASWTEDLLFIEPESKCVNLNLTMDWTIHHHSVGGGLDSGSFGWTDRGGFVDLTNQDAPPPNEPKFNDLDLTTRATVMGRAHNFVLARFFNLTTLDKDKNLVAVNSHLGKTYLPKDSDNDVRSYFDFLKIDPDYQEILTLADSYSESLFAEPGGCRNFSSSLDTVYTTGISCGLMLPPPRIIKRTEKMVHYSKPLYSCASALKASIKQVTFMVSDADVKNPQAISMLDIQEKEYSSASPAPLWGVEHSGQKIISTLPIWGIIDEATSKLPDVLSVRSPSLYLPGAVQDGEFSNLGSGHEHDNFPGAELATLSLTGTYSTNPEPDLWMGDPSWGMYYSGSVSTQLTKRWEELSKSPEGAAKIPGQIWTDLVANAVMGTRGVLGAQNNQTRWQWPGNRAAHVVAIEWTYTIPAFLCLALLSLLTAFGAFMILTGRTSFAKTKQIVRQTSVGRVLTACDGYEGGTMMEDEVEWKKSAGKRRYDLSGEVPESAATEDTSYKGRGLEHSNSSPL